MVYFIQQNSNLSNGLDNKTIRRGEHGVFFIQQNSNCFCSCLPTNSPSPEGQWRKEKNGGNWLLNHLGCPNDPRGYGIDGDDDDDDDDDCRRPDSTCINCS